MLGEHLESKVFLLCAKGAAFHPTAIIIGMVLLEKGFAAQVGLRGGVHDFLHRITILHTWHSCQRATTIIEEVAQNKLTAPATAHTGYTIQHLAMIGLIVALFYSHNQRQITVEIHPCIWQVAHIVICIPYFPQLSRSRLR